jgi:hypothetical protein
MTVIGDVDTEVIWLTEPDLGTINNGATSTLEVVAVNVGGRTLQYRIVSGSASKLPQGLTLLPSGNISGKVSFNTVALDGGTYAKFKTWRESVIDYALYQTTFVKKIKSQSEYINHLAENYATGKAYKGHLIKMIEQVEKEF